MPNIHHTSLTRYLDIDLKDVLTDDQREEILFLATSGMIHERRQCNEDFVFVDNESAPPKPKFPENVTIKEHEMDPYVMMLPLMIFVILGLAIFVGFLLR